jgi:tellurite resistance protein TerC
MELEHPLWMWAVFVVSVVVLLAFDLGVLHKKPREIKVREALMLSGFYILIALAFNLWVFFSLGQQSGYEFFVGYVIEKSLSIDNIFVFVLIFGHFAIPPKSQHRVIFWGIIGAILLRAAMIMLGAELIHEFDAILYVFGAFLIYSGIKMLIVADKEPDIENNPLLRFMRKRFRVADQFSGEKFFIRQNGVRYMTPLFVVLMLIQVSDVVFAVDSIPAIFAVTTDSFIVLTSNIFAILGLRALYFALAAIIHRFHYLKYGLSLILVFIGSKMVVNHYMDAKIISTELSLVVTLALLGLSIGVSLLKSPSSTSHS